MLYLPITFPAFQSEEFPSNLFFDQFYNDPHDLSTQPQPIIRNVLTGNPYEYTLTSPKTIADVNLVDPIVLPPIHINGTAASRLAKDTYRQIVASLMNTQSNPCASCQKLLTYLGQLAKKAPQTVPDVFVRICYLLNLVTPTSACEKNYGLRGFGPTISQVLAYSQTEGYDGQYICHTFFQMCPIPQPTPFKLEDYVPKPRPQITSYPKKRSNNGKRLKVLHLSDFHIDPRYAIGSEANCVGPSVCCRLPSISANMTSPPTGTPITPAPRFGDYLCDTPLALAAATLQAIPVLTRGEEEEGTSIDFSIFTGDLVSHDLDYQLSRDYVTYTETLVFGMLKRVLGDGPVYAALGNHDTYVDAQGTPNLGVPENIREQFSWNYENVARLWARNKWLPEDVAEKSKAHYGAYAVERYDGLKIISINTEMWYSNNLMNIEDEFQIYYKQNGASFTAERAVAVSWIGPSVTPLTNYNGGFRMYEVDPDTFEILDAHTWYSNVSTYSTLKHTGPMFQYEYSTRETYGTAIPEWPWDAPLNATWWHRVTEKMLKDGGKLIGLYNQYLGRQSAQLSSCNTTECTMATVCRMRVSNLNRSFSSNATCFRI
ncbi:hypothetical protein CROQUDRAFT_52923 [Cronartium quercuum f. sp. fusiforme G11]|uniref:Calcineurin-like phosphoesterase domain-containing protein n=1 Tax=Cronartium quercuum f. sp. fusiforme G11 TaxID=708437 RepID=A0A9P6N6M0_9BASI|nr:hypothetical protein CROQUDRAFT_52923 [Cronartium quercuum f. sp. fusiforme G11]